MPEHPTVLQPPDDHRRVRPEAPGIVRGDSALAVQHFGYGFYRLITPHGKFLGRHVQFFQLSPQAFAGMGHRLWVIFVLHGGLPV